MAPHRIAPARQDGQKPASSRAQILPLPAKKRAWMGLLLAGAFFLGLAGCQGPRPAHPPAAPVAPPVRPRTAISPAAWRLEAERWVGVNYRKGGLDREGIDCSGLTCRIYRQVAGISLPRTSEAQFRRGQAVARHDLRPGDLIFFCSLNWLVVDHVGIYLGDTQFVHASPSKGVVVSSLRQDYYLTRYYAARRLVP
ncbi:MAG: NlpC/P60 family protein [Verrucomicrobiota bacterium]